MKIYNQRQKRTYIIIALSIILLLMGVGYAAFSSMLNINGTASISNSWCVGFDITKTNTYTVKKGIETGQTPTGTMNYTGSACEINYKPNASLASAFYQPGDEIEYTLTIKNKSSVTAAIKSIVINGNESVSSDWTHTDGNISYKVFMPEDTTLDSNEETTMKVITKFQDDTPIEGSYTRETKTLSIAINSEQDDGEGGMITNPPYTGTIYRNNTNIIYNNVNLKEYVLAHNTGGMGPSDSFETEEECLAKYPNQGTYYCQIAENALGTYTTDATTLNNNYYLKHDIVDDIITASYVCIVYNNTEYCMKGADNGASYATNTQIIQDYQTFYNLNNVSYPSSSNPGCYFSSSNSYCSGGDFSTVSVASNGDVIVYGLSGPACEVYPSFYSKCG